MINNGPISASIPEFYRHVGGSLLEELLAHIDQQFAVRAVQWPPEQFDPWRAARTLGWSHVLDAGGETARQTANVRVLQTLPRRMLESGEVGIAFWLAALFNQSEVVIEIRRALDESLPPWLVVTLGSRAAAEHLPGIRRVLRELCPAHVVVDERSVSFLEERM